MGDDSGDFNKELSYDLRQIYAGLVGEHLIDAAVARKEQEFYKWFKALEDIKTIVAHKFKKKDDSTDYNKMVKEIEALAVKKRDTYLGETRDDAEAVKEFDAKLRALEEWLYKIMEAAGIFGDTYRQPSF